MVIKKRNQEPIPVRKRSVEIESLIPQTKPVKSQQQASVVANQLNNKEAAAKVRKFTERDKDIDWRNNDNLDPVNHPEFKTFKEQSEYVIKYLKQQGVDIYDENNTPGMYLHKRGDSRFAEIFKDSSKTNSESKQQNSENQDSINNSDLASFFS